MNKLNKTDGIINWSDNLEMSNETDTQCEHDDIEHGECQDCGVNANDLYEDIYHAEGSDDWGIYE